MKKFRVNAIEVKKNPYVCIGCGIKCENCTDKTCNYYLGKKEGNENDRRAD